MWSTGKAAAICGLADPLFGTGAGRMAVAPDIGPQKTCARILANATLQAKSNEANFRERGIVSGHGFTEV